MSNRPDHSHHIDVLSAVRAGPPPPATGPVPDETGAPGDRPRPAAQVSDDGAAWLASADRSPRSILDLWAARPTAPCVLPCGTAFDVVSAPAFFGRRMVDRLRSDGPGPGPVAVHRDRLLLFAAPGTAHRLPALLTWEEWGPAVPPLLCHGPGDAVTVPPLSPPPDAPRPSRWLIAPDVRDPWLPGTEVLLRSCVRAARNQRPQPGQPSPVVAPAVPLG